MIEFHIENCYEKAWSILNFYAVMSHLPKELTTLLLNRLEFVVIFNLVTSIMRLLLSIRSIWCLTLLAHTTYNLQVVIKVKPALSEGSLLCILWIITGSWNGAFLFSAVDGHYDTNLNEPDGPTSAALLGLSTFIGTANLRILFALGTAVLEHREVGVTKGEELIPLEIAFGSMLMSAHGECCTPVSYIRIWTMKSNQWGPIRMSHNLFHSYLGRLTKDSL